jgi:hypothetical protein
MHPPPDRLPLACAAVAALAALAAAQGPATVVPAPYASADAPGLSLWPFGAFDARRQLLLDNGATGLRPGQWLTALSVRRNGNQDGDHLLGGRIALDLELSTPMVPVRHATDDFAANRGSAPLRVFSGLVDLPPCPPADGDTAPWSAPFAVTIPFVSPFRVVGATLCIETLTTLHTDPVSGRTDLPWWPVDTEVWRHPQPPIALGDSCWTAAGPQPAGAIAATFSPGSRGVFHLSGTVPNPNVQCLVGLGDRLRGAIPLPIPLDGLGAPGCTLQVDPQFGIQAALLPAARGARAEAIAEVPLPAVAALSGMQIFAQWLVVDPGANALGLATTNGLRVTLNSPSGGPPTVSIESTDLASATGRLLRGRTPVLRFSH